MRQRSLVVGIVRQLSLLGSREVAAAPAPTTAASIVGAPPLPLSLRQHAASAASIATAAGRRQSAAAAASLTPAAAAGSAAFSSSTRRQPPAVKDAIKWGAVSSSSSASGSGSGSGSAASTAPGAAAAQAAAPLPGLAPRPPQLRLNDLADAPGAVAAPKRLGRGDGGGLGTSAGRGVKGQRARGGGKPGLLFDGGTKALRKLPKAYSKPSNPVKYATVNLGTVADWVEAGRLDATAPITMRELRASGAVAKRVLWGVKLLARGGARVARPLHLQVSAVSDGARRAVEAAGGSVTTVYYNRLSLRALLKPEAFAAKGRALPRPPRSWPPRDAGKFDAVGALPPVEGVPTAPALPPAGGGGVAAAGAAVAQQQQQAAV